VLDRVTNATSYVITSAWPWGPRISSPSPPAARSATPIRRSTSLTTPAWSSPGYHPAAVGQPFSYTLAAASDGSAPTSYAWRVHSPGLTFDAGAHQITGIPGTGGVFAATLSAQFPWAA